MPAKINLAVPAKLEREIITRAKAMFPRESFAYILGTIAGDSVHLDELWIPDDLDQWTSEDCVLVQPSWAVDAAAEAKESGLVIVAWLHSHCYLRFEGEGLMKDRSQSEADLDCGFQLPISAICVVQDIGKKRRRLRASVKFWGFTLPVEVKTV
jgi:hypothetical protein